MFTFSLVINQICRPLREEYVTVCIYERAVVQNLIDLHA